MSNWRDQILQEFTPQVARLTLVADPDGLLAEEGVLQGLRERGFELIPFEDHVAFRFAYESKYRSRWDRGKMTDLVVVLRAETQELRHLPYDLLQAGRKLSFKLGDLFPNLSYRVVEALDRSDLDALYRAQAQYNPEMLGDNATKDFVLRHVFEIAPELIKQPSDLLRILLRRHDHSQRIPAILDERFVQILRQNGRFPDWSLEQIIPDRNEFFAFLQERWPIFLERMAKAEVRGVREAVAAYNLKYSGPSDIPFDHDEVRTYVSRLFLDARLQPVANPNAERLARDWLGVGVLTDPASYRLKRLHGLLESLEASIPADEARHQEWLAFAQEWAELIVLWHKVEMSKQQDLKLRLLQLQQQIDATFLNWVQRRFAGLHNQPALPPVMIHHIPRALAHQLAQSSNEKIALVLLDGMALDQWVVLREVLLSQRHKLKLSEGAIFAWIPTITSVSRQAAFAGKPPLYFPSSIWSTDKEASLWTNFWSDHGLTPAEVAYVKGLGDGDLNKIEETLSYPKVRVIGLVVDKIDKIMHGMELGTAGMHNQVRQWAQQGFMAQLVDFINDHGFSIYLTSDHGNLEAVGYGRPSEGAIADLRGERVRVYPSQILRARVQESLSDAMAWPTLGLPEDFLPLLAPSRRAFTRSGERIVAHGGVSIEELVIPFIRIIRREN